MVHRYIRSSCSGQCSPFDVCPYPESSADIRCSAFQYGEHEVQKLACGRGSGLAFPHTLYTGFVVAADVSLRDTPHMCVYHTVQYVTDHRITHFRDMAVMLLAAGVLDLSLIHI